MALWQKALLLAISGSLGTLARAGVSAMVPRLVGGGYPWATTIVNVVGCLAFGFVWAFAEKGLPASADARYIVLTGFMGAFTTFSTYLFETHALLSSGRIGIALLTLSVQNLLGLAAIVGGLLLGRLS